MIKLWGLVLAGGRSSRMGQDKALLPYKGKRLIDSMVDLLVAITGDSSRVLVSGKVEACSCVEDEFPGQGPLEGLRCCLKIMNDGDVLVLVPVDMPLLSPACIEDLVRGLRLNRHFVRFSDSELPCVLRVSKKMRDVLSSLSDVAVPPGQRSFKSFFSYLEGEHIRCSSPRSLANTNTPEEWQEIFK